jgi:hypothetical protein
VGEESTRESALIRLREEANFKAAANLLSAVADLRADMISVRRESVPNCADRGQIADEDRDH